MRLADKRRKEGADIRARLERVGAINQTNSFDLSGNLTSTGNQTYSYDDRARLKTALANGNTTSYLINYQQLRVKKANSQETKHFVYDDAGHMLGEYDHQGNAIQELIWLGDTPIALTGTMPCLNSASSTTNGSIGNPTCTENATALIFTDHLNTPREIVRIGASAANGYNASSYTSLWKWDSLPFGETEPNANPSNLGTMAFNHRFPGQYYDQETGLNQNWNRDYDAKIGRYVTSDPVGLAGGLNTYAYAFNDPAQRTDVTGLKPGECFGSAENAARDASKYAHGEGKNFLEYGGWTARSGSGNFIASIVSGAPDAVSIGTKPENAVAAWHTHPGAFSSATGQNQFSDKDIGFVKSSMVPLYLMGPNGDLQVLNGDGSAGACRAKAPPPKAKACS